MTHDGNAPSPILMQLIQSIKFIISIRIVRGFVCIRTIFKKVKRISWKKLNLMDIKIFSIIYHSYLVAEYWEKIKFLLYCRWIIKHTYVRSILIKSMYFCRVIKQHKKGVWICGNICVLHASESEVLYIYNYLNF